MKKTITIYQMSPDSIDVDDQITVDIYSQEQRLLSLGCYYREPMYELAHITEVNYEGHDISGVIDQYFTEAELLNVNDGSDLTTKKNLYEIKKIADEYALENDYKYQPFKK